jgi:peptidoglycan/LPS O-acetylase OafA/YrhL
VSANVRAPAVMTEGISRPSTPASPRPRLVWLDVAKGLGILWIVLFHAEISVGRFDKVGDGLAHRAWANALDVFFGLGIQGVTIFVAASGFALTYAAMRHDKRVSSLTEYPSWIGKRLWQLLPLYWFAHLVMFVLYSAGAGAFKHASAGLWIASFFGVNGWIPGWFGGIRSAWWFEGLIIQLAILYPLLAWALDRLSIWKFLALAWCATLLSRYVCVSQLYDWNVYLQYGVFSGCRLFEFAIGMAAARYMWERKRPARLWVVAALSIAALAGYLATTAHRPQTWIGPYVFLPTLSSASICILAWLVASAVARVKYASAALVWCGVMTYPIFLMHGLASETQIGLAFKAGIGLTAAIALMLMASGVAQGYLFKKAADATLTAWRALFGAAFHASRRERVSVAPGREN